MDATLFCLIVTEMYMWLFRLLHNKHWRRRPNKTMALTAAGLSTMIGSHAYADNVNSVLQDQVSSGLHYSISGSLDNLVTVGWEFTANSDDLSITQLSTLTGETGNTDYITLWNADTNELLAQVGTISDTDGWRTVGLDNAISLEDGSNYAITLTTTNGNHFRFVRESFTEASTDGNITYTNSIWNTGYAPYFQGPNGVAPIQNANNFPDVIGEYQWLVDFGFVDSSQANINEPTAVPTPAAFGIGGLMLGLLTLRRNKQT
ncbi:DUF4082 domain-containing protein [Planctomycetota bacterium]|nr:DUF4082 domain-containing protein [Planctomycetota bacterium]